MPAKTKLDQRKVAIIIAGVLVVVIGFVYWRAQRKTSNVSTVTPSAHVSPSSSKAPLSAAAQPTTNPKAYAPTSGDLSPTSGGQLPAPTGQLLNLHTISLSADPAMESVCQTVASASCDVQLTYGGITKSLGAQNTGSNGIVVFDWKAQQLGLTTGQWTVEAVVTQNGQTATSTTDTLVVNP